MSSSRSNLVQAKKVTIHLHENSSEISHFEYFWYLETGDNYIRSYFTDLVKRICKFPLDRIEIGTMELVTRGRLWSKKAIENDIMSHFSGDALEDAPDLI